MVCHDATGARPFSWGGPPVRFLWAALIAGVACGGKATDDSDDEGNAPTAQRDPAPAGEGDSSASNGGTPLPECRLGFDSDEEPDRPCNWLANGRCYEDKLAACACVCSRKKNTTCSSGFDEPNGRVKVSCF
jgi:hypothetical protein